jgi:nickel/cobalt exporter
VRIALFHVLSAIVIVLLTDFAVRQVTGKAPSDYRTIRLISYAGIAAIGLFMLRAAIRQARLKHSHGPDQGDDETHHHHHPGCAACDALDTKKGPAAWLSLAVGAVPCTGALLVLLYGLANDMLWPAILMVIAISLGMALTLSALGIAAILGRRLVNQRVGEDPERQHRLTNGLRIAGALVITIIGAGLFTFTLRGARSVPPEDANTTKTLSEDRAPE